MRRLIIFFLLYFFTSVGNAQSTDIIMLKNAEVFRGTITDTIPGDSLRMFLLPERTPRTFSFSQIEKIILKDSQKENPIKSNVATQVKQGNTMPLFYQAFFRLGIGWESGLEENNGNAFFKTDIINALSLGRYASLGVGLGARLGFEGSTLVPLFADIRIAPGRYKVSPALGLSFGTLYQADREWVNNGVYLNVEAGLRIGRPYQTQVMILIGFEQFDYLTTTDVGGFFGSSITHEVYKSYSGVSLGIVVAF